MDKDSHDKEIELRNQRLLMAIATLTSAFIILMLLMYWFLGRD